VLGVLAFWIGLGLPLNRYGHLLWLVLCIASIVTIVWRVRGGVAEVRTTQSPSMSE
jgi:CDP-diacylglycerol--glycerol-3-phosphate 3-phosphatidyltransferase